MNPENEREERLFCGALEKMEGPERRAFLNQACGDDKELRQRLEALIQAHDNPGTSLEPEQAAVSGGVKATIRLSFPDDEAVGTRIDRYKLLQKIGEGGMGVVYIFGPVSVLTFCTFSARVQSTGKPWYPPGRIPGWPAMSEAAKAESNGS
jgi:hypothetical protein